MRFFILTSFLGLVLLSSCEVTKELDNPKKIVLDSRIQADRSPEVTLKVVDAFGQTLTSDALKDSKITLQAEGSTEIPLELSSFSDVSSSFYADLLIEAGRRYTLLVQTPGFGDLYSFTDVPDKVIAFTDSSGERGPKGGLLPDGDRFLLPYSFGDPVGQDNYYHIVVTARDANSDIEVVLPETLAYTMLPVPSDAKRFEETGWLFGDKDFRGGVFSGKIVILKESVLQFPNPVVTIELRTVSVDYFNYHIQNSRPKSNNLPNHGQAGGIDNVAGGAGLFAGFSSAESTYQLEF